MYIGQLVIHNIEYTELYEESPEKYLKRHSSLPGGRKGAGAWPVYATNL